jgi:hypothetical protein
MKKFLLCLLFLPLTSYASNWVYLTKSSDGVNFFIDTKSKVLIGNEVTFWVLVNLNLRNSQGSLSIKANETINCRTRELKTNYFISYSDFDGKGKINSDFKTPQEWEPIPPDSINSIKLNFACKKN